MREHPFHEAWAGRGPEEPRAVPAVVLICLLLANGLQACATVSEAPSAPAPAPRDVPRAQPQDGGEGDGAGGAAPAVSAVPAAPEALEPSGIPVHGSITTTVRDRWTSGENDLEARARVLVDVGDPERHAWTAHFSARLHGDLDGKQDPGSPFYSLDDTEDGTIVPRLYDAYAERRGQGFLARTRLGRQTIWDTPAFAWFDGASVETKESGKARVSFGAYGGLPVHLYESSRSDDLLAGLYGQARPWEGGRLRLDWMHAADDGTLGDHTENAFKASAWQSLGTSARVDASFSRLGGDARDWSAGATWNDREDALTLSARYYELQTTQEALPPEFDPFYPILQALYPYRQAQLLASKGFGRKLVVSAGADFRRVSDDSDVGTFNRDFDRYFTTWQLLEVLPAALVLGLTGEVWDGDGSDIESWGVDLSRHFGETVDASLGSYYSKYKTDVFVTTEREDVRTWYLRVRWKKSTSSSFDLGYELEDFDPDTLHSLRLGWTWRF